MKLSDAVRSLIIVATFLFTLSSTAAFGQSERGTIAGSVTDTTGAAMPGAKVSATELSTNVSSATTTNDSGDYTLPNLPAGRYNVRVEKEGFASAVRTGITLDASATVRADAKLAIGSTKQTIE